MMKKNVRVLIKTTGFTDSYHKKVTLTSKSAFTVRIGKKTTQYPANAKVTFTKKDKAALKKKMVEMRSSALVRLKDRTDIHLIVAVWNYLYNTERLLL